MTTTHNLFAQIAREHLDIETLQTRNMDRLDFHDVAVWQVAKALQAAYDAGRQSTRRRRSKNKRTNISTLPKP